MSRFTVASIAASMLLFASVAPSSAQPLPPSSPRPTFSPYLGLLASRGNPGMAYMGIVRPQMMQQQQLGQLQSQYQQAMMGGMQSMPGMTYGVDPNLGQTGHPVMFNMTGHYFSSNPVSGRGGARMGGYGGGTPSSFGNLPGVYGTGGGYSTSGTTTRMGGANTQSTNTGNAPIPGGSALGASRGSTTPKR